MKDNMLKKLQHIQQQKHYKIIILTQQENLYGMSTKSAKLVVLLIVILISKLVKINDQTRYGCIALEILSDSDYLKIFGLRDTINGVNHIYCKYLTKHPTDP